MGSTRKGRKRESLSPTHLHGSVINTSGVCSHGQIYTEMTGPESSQPLPPDTESKGTRTGSPELQNGAPRNPTCPCPAISNRGGSDDPLTTNGQEENQNETKKENLPFNLLSSEKISIIQSAHSALLQAPSFQRRYSHCCLNMHVHTHPHTLHCPGQATPPAGSPTPPDSPHCSPTPWHPL